MNRRDALVCLAAGCSAATPLWSAQERGVQPATGQEPGVRSATRPFSFALIGDTRDRDHFLIRADGEDADPARAAGTEADLFHGGADRLAGRGGEHDLVR